MKNTINILVLISLISIVFVSCEKDEADEMDIHFKSGGTYISSSSSIAEGTAVMIGIEAETDKEKDPIIRFNISESINNGDANTVYTESMEKTSFEYDYNFTLNDSIQGNTHRYLFTITNRDGLTAQKSLTLTVE